MNPAKKAITYMDQLARAAMIKRTLGVRAAAGYMRRQGWSIEAALYWLVGTSV